MILSWNRKQRNSHHVRGCFKPLSAVNAACRSNAQSYETAGIILIHIWRLVHRTLYPLGLNNIILEPKSNTCIICVKFMLSTPVLPDCYSYSINPCSSGNGIRHLLFVCLNLLNLWISAIWYAQSFYLELLGHHFFLRTRNQRSYGSFVLF